MLGLRDETLSSGSGVQGGSFSKKAQLQADAEEIVAAECLLCGDRMIE
jgi:hypothetical protein